MNIVLCATRNMYPQMQQMITMLNRTQPNIDTIYLLTEDDMNCTGDVKCINVNNYPNIIQNRANSNNPWTYMCFSRCYLADMLPDVDKILYLDLDIHIDKSINELWDTDITDCAVGGVIDINARNHFLPYIPNLNVYINSGVLLMNLKYFREHNITDQLHTLLNSYRLAFPDQDAINIVCKDHIKFLSHKWNSGGPCGLHDDAIIHHCSIVKPWDPQSKWFKSWADDYIRSGAAFSKEIG